MDCSLFTSLACCCKGLLHPVAHSHPVARNDERIDVVNRRPPATDAMYPQATYVIARSRRCHCAQGDEAIPKQ